MSRPERIRALCCECGMLRTYSSSYAGRKSGMEGVVDFEGFDDEESLRECQERGHFAGVQPFWRCTIGLKCRECARFTRHAYLRDGEEHADYAELEDYRRLARK